jgi:hypothetical protein
MPTFNLRKFSEPDRLIDQIRKRRPSTSNIAALRRKDRRPGRVHHMEQTATTVS